MNIALQRSPSHRLYALTAAGISVLIAIIVASVSSGLAAGLVLGAILAIIGFSRYEALIHALIVLLPMQSSLPYGMQNLGTANPFNMLAGVIFAIWLANALMQRQRLINGSAMNFVLLLFFLLCCLALFNAGRISGSAYMMDQVNALKRWLSPMMLFFPIANARLSRRAIKRLVITALIMTGVVSLWTLKDYHMLGWHNISQRTRIGGPFGRGGENDLAAFFVYYPVIALAVGLCVRNLIGKAAMLGVFTISMLPLLLSLSRGAYLGMVTVLVFVGLVRFRWLLPLVVVALLLHEAWVPNVVNQRLESTRVESNERVGGRVPSPNDPEWRLETSSALRVRIWRGGWRMVQAYPVTGIGYNRFPLAVPKYANMEWGMDAHNMYLRVAAEMGVGSLLVFLLLFIVPFSTMVHIYRTTKDRLIQGWMLGCMASIWGIGVVNFFGSRLVREELVGLYWVFVALTYSYLYMRRRRAARLMRHRQLRADGLAETLLPPRSRPALPAPPA